jgi:hypothetical protein
MRETHEIEFFSNYRKEAYWHDRLLTMQKLEKGKHKTSHILKLLLLQLEVLLDADSNYHKPPHRQPQFELSFQCLPLFSFEVSIKIRKYLNIISIIKPCSRWPWVIFQIKVIKFPHSKII